MSETTREHDEQEAKPPRNQNEARHDMISEQKEFQGDDARTKDADEQQIAEIRTSLTGDQPNLLEQCRLEGEKMLSTPGGFLKYLISTYGNITESEDHSMVAQKIFRAVYNKDRKALLQELGDFANARSGSRFGIGFGGGSSPHSQMYDMMCFKYTSQLQHKLQAMKEIPWDELEVAIERYSSKPEHPAPEQKWYDPKRWLGKRK